LIYRKKYMDKEDLILIEDITCNLFSGAEGMREGG
jgi:hypothetical protein